MLSPSSELLILGVWTHSKDMCQSQSCMYMGKKQSSPKLRPEVGMYLNNEKPEIWAEVEKCTRFPQRLNNPLAQIEPAP